MNRRAEPVFSCQAGSDSGQRRTDKLQSLHGIRLKNWPDSEACFFRTGD